MPRRYQRSRRKGAHLPPGTRYVGRPGPWGNPHDWRILGRAEAVRRFVADLDALPAAELERRLQPLRGKDLSCYCPLTEICHADVWLRLANP